MTNLLALIARAKLILLTEELRRQLSTNPRSQRGHH